MVAGTQPQPTLRSLTTRAQRAAIVSFRLGGRDGVSVMAATWATVLHRLGWEVTTVAGVGVADRLLPGLAWPRRQAPPHEAELRDLFSEHNVVVVENLCSLPLNPEATAVVVEALRGRPAVLHHHDLPWQRPTAFDSAGWPPTDPAWRHVVTNRLSQTQLAERRITASVIYNAFDVDQPQGERLATRIAMGFAPDETVVLHPVRAIERKRIPLALAMCESLAATYWLTGPAEEDYGSTLAGLLAAARCRVVHGPPPRDDMAGAYAACDAVVFPSACEGFGNPVVESAIHRRPLAVSDYPVALELASHGFRWFPVDQPELLRAFLRSPDFALMDHNAGVARRHFSLDRLGADLHRLLASWSRVAR